jgi:hypothetical protein
MNRKQFLGMLIGLPFIGKMIGMAKAKYREIVYDPNDKSQSMCNIKVFKSTYISNK